MTIFFLHGLESSGNGTKGRFFHDHYPHVITPDFSGTLEERMQQLEILCDTATDLILIGSSFGGLMAVCFALRHPDRVRRLILLAPALNYPFFHPPEKKLSLPTLLVIGKQDTITPASQVTPVAERCFNNLQLQLVDEDHLLHKAFLQQNWPELLAV